MSSQMVLNCDLFFCSKTKYINLSLHWCQAWEPELLPNPRSCSQQHNGQLTMPVSQPERMSLFSLPQQIAYCLAHRLLDLVNCPKLYCFSVKLSSFFPLILFINKMNFYFHFLAVSFLKMTVTFNLFFSEYICLLEACRNHRNDASSAGLGSLERRVWENVKCYNTVKWRQMIQVFPKILFLCFWPHLDCDCPVSIV